METRYKTLFLHGGPGLHCSVERTWFGNSLPVFWWDQPSVAAEPEPYAALVTNAVNQLKAMSESAGGQIDLIAHSFGGQIAAALAREQGELIRSITLLGCPPSPLLAFLNFARRLLDNPSEHPGLKEKLTAIEEYSDMNRFLALIQACYPSGTLPDSYFGSNSNEVKVRYSDIATRTPPLDIATFMAVMQEFLHTRIPAAADSYTGDVTLLMGRNDPLLRISGDSEKWLKVFPHAKLRTYPAGHFLQYELPPETWCAGL